MERGYKSAATSGFDLLRQPLQSSEILHDHDLQVAIEPEYGRYHKIHKVLVGSSGGQELERIHEALKDSTLPRQLHVAGWAAVESALAQPENSAWSRNQLVEQGVECWARALRYQLSIQEAGERPWLMEDSAAFRYALDICHAPLVQAMIAGNVTQAVKTAVITDAMQIAQAAQVQLHLAERTGDVDAVGDFIGFGYENNGLIFLNMITDGRGVAIPSSPRAGSGYHYPEQTHDISFILQHWGKIRKILPIEVKAATSQSDRNRYYALLLRGKMHLSIEGAYHPRATLDSLIRFHEGKATERDLETIGYASTNVINLIRLYKQGGHLGHLATTRTVTKFHDKKFVEHLYNGQTFNKPA